MKEFEQSQIQGARAYFEGKSYPAATVEVTGHSFNYFVIPQEENPALSDFAMRMTRTDPATGAVDGIFGVSDSVPEGLRPYWARHEYIEFTQIGINQKRRCVEAEHQVIQLMPDDLTHRFVQRRIQFFQNLVGFFTKAIEEGTGDYTEDDLEEAQNTLLFLYRIKPISEDEPPQDIKRRAEDMMKEYEPEFYGDREGDDFLAGVNAFVQEFQPRTDIVYYPGSNTHIGPSKVDGFKDSRVIYADSEYMPVKALQEAGYEAHFVDAEEYNPGKVDILILLNFWAEKPPTLVKPGGYVICNNWWGAAARLYADNNFELVGALVDSEGEEARLVREDVDQYMTPVQSEEEWRELYAENYKYALERIKEHKPDATNLIDTINELKQAGAVALPRIPFKKFASLLIYRRK